MVKSMPENPTCTKCGKTLTCTDSKGNERFYAGTVIDIDAGGDEKINEFLRLQLGKYAPSDGTSNLRTFLCFECFLDGILASGNVISKPAKRSRKNDYMVVPLMIVVDEDEV